MNAAQVLLYGMGAVLVCVGSVKYLRKENGARAFLFIGSILFMVGSLVLSRHS